MSVTISWNKALRGKYGKKTKTKREKGAYQIEEILHAKMMDYIKCAHVRTRRNGGEKVDRKLRTY